MLPAFLGLSGPVLTDAERGLIRDADPAGFCLFGRNIVDRAQLRALTDTLRAVSGRADLPILVDQEGGRVARLRPPLWPEFPAAVRFAALYEKAPMSAIEAARANAQAMALLLGEAGINANAAPVLDLLHSGADAVVGDRAFGAEPMQVAALGRAVLDGLAAGGVAGIIKHMPGHGRAGADSHHHLPIVEASAEALAADLAPFRALAARAPMAMTAHILYPTWDRRHPATLSPTIVANVIRGEIGFDGLLMTDDIAMDALSGTLAERAQAALAAGVDIVLHCSGEAADNEALANALPQMGEAAAARLARAMTLDAAPADLEALIGKRDALLACA
ncbi:MAG TPA: beta-N-acetylhexosaminidase [Allosphingosinicella sp.]|nr:beta-N-acetylhexosaminidase [Allosphingosinicella sp.]